MDIIELIRRIIANNELARFQATATTAQFGLAPEIYLGATILPEREVEGNVYEDEGLRYRSVVANDAARYSPVQLKEAAAMFGSMLAKLAESDIGREFTAEQFDRLKRILTRGDSFAATANVLGWLDREVFQALLRRDEIRRWQCLEFAAVDLRGDNSYAETVAYENPTGHRVTVGGSWDTKTAGVSDRDPMVDVFTIMQLFVDKGIRIARVIMSGKTQFRLADNTKFADRAQYGAQGFIPPNSSIIRGFPAISDVAAVFGRVGLPVPEIYDGTYEDIDGRHRYLSEDKIVFIGETDASEEVAPDEGDPFRVGNTLGFTGIGTPQGEDDPGRVFTLRAHTDDKPYRIVGKGWETSLPILEQPEHVAVLDTIP